MKIHFIFPLAKYDWPLVKSLGERLPEATFDCGGVSGFGQYHHRMQMFAKLPWLAYYALNSCMARMKQDPLPDFVCVGTHIGVIGCLLARIFTGKTNRIIFLGFIYTPRKLMILNKLRWLYFRFLLSRTAGVICYSKFESKFLSDSFGLTKTIFASSLYGGKLNIPKDLLIKQWGKPSYIVSAGRSGRDYGLLCEAVKDLSVKLHIICDSSHAMKGLQCPSNVTILRDCYGLSYIQELAGADIVLLPLKDENLSSGQMVLLDAMALGKAVIITETVTTVEYGEHLKTCYFVKPGSVDEMRSAIDYIYKHQHVMESIGSEAKRRYTNCHSIEPCVNSMVAAIERIAHKTAQM